MGLILDCSWAIYLGGFNKTHLDLGFLRLDNHISFGPTNEGYHLQFTGLNQNIDLDPKKNDTLTLE